MKFSVIIPAHNEEKYISKCLESIASASKEVVDQVEIVVVLNRCSDKTEDIARSFGSTIVVENGKNLSKIRNAGVKAASGDVVVTIDADSWMSKNMLKEIKKNIEKNEYIGGDVQVRVERMSWGILLSCLFFIVPVMMKNQISMGSFWCYKEVFQEIRGFDESLLTAEDIDFAIRLKKYGKTRKKRYKTIHASHIVTSCRKWDRYGDWYIFKNIQMVKKVFQGTNSDVADKWWYDAEK